MRHRRLRRASARSTTARIERTLELMRHRGPDDRTHRRFDDARRARGRAAPHPAQHHRPRPALEPAVPGRRPLARLQRRALQLRRGARRARARRGVEFRTELRHRGAARRARRATAGTALDRCEGMWAFARLRRARPATLALCARPLRREAAVPATATATGSTSARRSKFIASLLGRRLAVNHRHLHRYLVNGYKALYKTGETFFDGRRGAAGRRSCCGSAAGGDERRGALLGPRRRRSRTSMSYEEAVAGTRERLIRSVELRLRADVPLAFCMSGGVDSLSLISIAKRVFDYDVHGFTIVNARRALRGAGHGRPRGRAELGVRHTADPGRHGGLPAAAARARPPARRARLHDHLLRALAADGVDRTSTATASRSAARRPTSSSPATTTTTSPTCTTCTREQALYARSLAQLARARRADRAQPVPPGPDLLRRRTPARRDHIYLGRRRVRRAPAGAVRRGVRRAQLHGRRCCATGCSTSCSPSPCR